LREAIVRTLAAAFLAGFLLLLLIVQWRSWRHPAAAASTSSQIYIHDTPVCVSMEGEEVVARVGKCPRESGVFEAPGPGRTPFHGAPGRGLPPGHPPIDRDMAPDANRRVLI
jgi:hypothetical protein